MPATLRLVSALLATLAIGAGTALAQDWPAKQAVKVVVPFTAGSATDIVARTVFDQVSKQVGQSFVTENRGGAGTTLGMAAVAKADPDGYTLLAHSTSHVVVQSTYAKLPFNVGEDFAGISLLATLPFVAATATKYKTLKDLITAGKAPGSSINYGTAGVGSSGQLFMERFRMAAGFPATHVPFRGTPEGMTEVVAGRLDMYPAPVLNAIELARDGRISVLAVSSAKRAPLMPNVPTLAEAGLPGYEAANWWGLVATGGTPRPIIEKLHGAVVKALDTDKARMQFEAEGAQISPLGPDEMTRFLASETEKWAKVVRQANIKAE